ncbi:MAG: SDR family oxidoreductase [Solirubrobacterales bacterium]|nr:SDR family oxidoreductase [Solirubrobacterales bacterium]MBV9536977.1 SDR family oxidoreductase [Solirubrobacterales bacterium]
MTVRLGLAGRCALVTGGTSNIASACVSRLCAEGVAVAFTGSNSPRGESIASETGGSFLECDHSDRASTDRAVGKAIERCGGRLDILVTNAGMQFEGSVEDTPEAVFRELLEVNLTSLFRVGRACFESMRAHGGGSMIHVGSEAGIRAAHETAAYSVMTAGAIAVAELFAAEGAPYRIRSNAVCPRAGTDAAALVAWLASDESASVSGATLRVDGGAGAAMLVDTRT